MNISQNNKKGKKLHTIKSKIKIIKCAKENSRIAAIKNIMYLPQHYRIAQKGKDFLDLESSKLYITTLHKMSKSSISGII